jgi:hypothetical protein
LAKGNFITESKSLGQMLWFSMQILQVKRSHLSPIFVDFNGTWPKIEGSVSRTGSNKEPVCLSEDGSGFFEELMLLRWQTRGTKVAEGGSDCGLFTFRLSTKLPRCMVCVH